MKSNLHFRMKSENRIEIMRNGKVIGDIWAKLADGTLPYPHENTDYCKDSIQICGFTEKAGPWGCGRFSGLDIVLNFTPLPEAPKKEDTSHLKEEIKVLEKVVEYWKKRAEEGA